MMSLRFFIGMALAVLSQSIAYSQVESIEIRQDEIDAKDAHVYIYQPSLNYGNSPWSYVRNGDHARNSYMEFDFTGIPSNAIILSAVIHLEVSSVYGPDNTMSIARCADAWDEMTITWANQPGVIIDDVINAPSNMVSGQQQFDVTSHVQLMVADPQSNHGWKFSIADFTGPKAYRDFRSSNYSVYGMAKKPAIYIQYMLPLDINPTTIIHESGSGSSDGEITATPVGGDGNYTYQWYDANGLIPGATTETIRNLSSGWYGLYAKDGSGFEATKIFLIGQSCAASTIEIQAPALFVKDAYLQSLLTPINTADQNYGGSAIFLTHKWTYSNVWNDIKSLLDIPVHYEPGLVFTQGDLTLFGENHDPYRRPNDSRLDKVVESWNESSVTWNTKPQVDYSSPVLIPGTSGSGDDRTLNVLEDLIFWQQNPSDAYGWNLELQDQVTQNYTNMRFYSSDHSTAAERPVLKVAFIMECVYAPMSTEVKSHFQLVKDGKLRVQFDELYADQDGKLEYTIYDDLHNIVMSHLNQSIPVHFGDNRLLFDLSCDGTFLADGHYLLEVVNEKKDRTYLRFKIEGNGASCQ